MTAQRRAQPNPTHFVPQLPRLVGCEDGLFMPEQIGRTYERARGSGFWQIEYPCNEPNATPNEKTQQ